MRSLTAAASCSAALQAPTAIATAIAEASVFRLRHKPPDGGDATRLGLSASEHPMTCVWKVIRKTVGTARVSAPQELQFTSTVLWTRRAGLA